MRLPHWISAWPDLTNAEWAQNTTAALQNMDKRLPRRVERITATSAIGWSTNTCNVKLRCQHMFVHIVYSAFWVAKLLKCFLVNIQYLCQGNHKKPSKWANHKMFFSLIGIFIFQGNVSIINAKFCYTLSPPLYRYIEVFFDSLKRATRRIIASHFIGSPKLYERGLKNIAWSDEIGW